MKPLIFVLLAVLVNGCGSYVHTAGPNACDPVFSATTSPIQTGVTAETDVTANPETTRIGALTKREDGSFSRTDDLYVHVSDTESYCGNVQFTFRNAVVTNFQEYKAYAH